uniref:Uncharacterized protein n=1 Tax=Fibrocapsa japonica TaxID=94617 RepID=A0A7S2V2S0_9STRA|mmetsp:Transcript_3591/g.5308  ORF Transcript_3591/g.5308 Transcript_3591/m.5308 type:complete len:303 (+) Transcript_3591:146-1054(+)
MPKSTGRKRRSSSGSKNTPSAVSKKRKSCLPLSPSEWNDLEKDIDFAFVEQVKIKTKDKKNWTQEHLDWSSAVRSLLMGILKQAFVIDSGVGPGLETTRASSRALVGSVVDQVEQLEAVHQSLCTWRGNVHEMAAQVEQTLADSFLAEMVPASSTSTSTSTSLLPSSNSAEKPSPESGNRPKKDRGRAKGRDSVGAEQVAEKELSSSSVASVGASEGSVLDMLRLLHAKLVQVVDEVQELQTELPQRLHDLRSTVTAVELARKTSNSRTEQLLKQGDQVAEGQGQSSDGAAMAPMMQIFSSP